MVNNVCLCASESMRGRTANQVDPCAASVADAERKKIFSDTYFFVNQFLPIGISISPMPCHTLCRESSEPFHSSASTWSDVYSDLLVSTYSVFFERENEFIFLGNMTTRTWFT